MSLRNQQEFIAGTVGLLRNTMCLFKKKRLMVPEWQGNHPCSLTKTNSMQGQEHITEETASPGKDPSGAVFTVKKPKLKSMSPDTTKKTYKVGF